MVLKRGNATGYGPVTPIDTHELAWAAGVLDGEGNVRVKHQAGRAVGLSIQVAQGHPEMVERFARAVGVGTVYGPKPWSALNPKPSWWFGAYSRDVVHRICWMLWPWLGSVKRQQFDSAFEHYHALRASTEGGE